VLDRRGDLPLCAFGSSFSKQVVLTLLVVFCATLAVDFIAAKNTARALEAMHSRLFRVARDA